MGRPPHQRLQVVGPSKLANHVLIPCNLLGDEVRLKHASCCRKGKGRCLDRNEFVESALRSGPRSSSGRCGLSSTWTSKSPPSSCPMKPQGSDPTKAMSPNAPLPAP